MSGTEELQKRCSVLLIIREMKTKPTRYQDTCTKMAKIRYNVNNNNTVCWQRCRTSRTLIHKGAATEENGLEFHTVKQILTTLTDTCANEITLQTCTQVFTVVLPIAAKSQKYSNACAFRWTHQLQNFQTMESLNNKNELWIQVRTGIVCKASAT